MKLVVDAPAKINLTLNMEGRREDGYHLLSSVFQAISLSDTVTLTDDGAQGITLSMTDPALPCDSRNTAYKAAQVFYEYTGITPCVSIYVEKRIPQQAGLGGGSSDAAGVLVGLNALHHTELSLETLCELGEKVGADVPFCIVGGTAMVTGIGEIIEPITPLSACHIVVAKPAVGISTAQAYRAVDSVDTVRADQAAMRAAIENGDLAAVGGLLSNAFEQALAIPEVEEVLTKMRTFSPLGCRMSGSGSAVYALFDDAQTASLCAHSLSSAVQSYECVPLNSGATIIKTE
ncbi:MAG: 4-(cytidine 5'-diphospho)-2-C-methyl-D-erythritol kinase [Ruminococcaceae bacterium]|nr:4-(cytidine 5'-diphospho)-2-C-methyl-D-erythritol kinase [Oscillospiraceae bacterium]